MRRDLPPDPTDRFSGKLRHYHRSSGKLGRTWDDWVEADLAIKQPARNWYKMAGFTLGLLGIGGIALGLLLKLG